jgi:hypothetical protein
MLLTGVFFFFETNHVNYMPKPTKNYYFKKQIAYLTHVPKVRTPCLIPTHHPTPKTKIGQHQSHPTIICTFPKEKGCGGCGVQKVEKTMVVV